MIHACPRSLLAATLLAACGSPGLRNKVGFAYSSGTGCQLGCDIATPMAQGTSETIVLFSAPQPFEVRSGDASVFTAARSGAASWIGNASVAVSAVGPGQAALQIEDENGNLVDEIPLSVEAPASVVVGEEVPSGGLETREVQLSLDGGIVSLVAQARDGRGTALQASTGWSYAFSGSPALAPATAGACSGDSIAVVPAAAGASTVTASLGALSDSVAVSVGP